MTEDPNSMSGYAATAVGVLLKVVKSHFFIGLFGAIVSLRGVPGATIWARIFNTFCGMLIAGFFTGALAEYFTLVSETSIGALAFALGLFGLNLVDQLREFIKTLKWSDYFPFRKRGE